MEITTISLDLAKNVDTDRKSPEPSLRKDRSVIAVRI
jgi:hypothetical protein